MTLCSLFDERKICLDICFVRKVDVIEPVTILGFLLSLTLNVEISQYYPKDLNSKKHKIKIN